MNSETSVTNVNSGDSVESLISKILDQSRAPLDRQTFTCFDKRTLLKDDFGEQGILSDIQELIVADSVNPGSQSNQTNDTTSPAFKRIHDLCGGKLEEYLILFDSVDKTLCRKLKWNKKEGKFQCNRCHNKGKKVWTKINGESIEFGPNQHICELQEFIEPRILQKHEYEIRKEPRGKKDVEHLYVFQNGERKKCYKYTWHNKNNYYICNSCKIIYEIYVYAKKFKYENGDDGIILTGKEHQCGLKDFVSIV